MKDNQGRIWHLDVSSPPQTIKLPANSCDSHCHVFGPARSFPFDPALEVVPGDSPKEALFAMQQTIGADRTVIVQSVNHGFDHAAVIDAIQSRPATTRGIALMRVDAGRDEIGRLAEAGFRGVRFHSTARMPGHETIDEIIAFGRVLAEFGWHLQLHLDSTTIASSAAAIRRSAVPVVIDHMGYPDASLGLDQPGFVDLLRLLDDRNVWVKVSGCDRASPSGAPYADAVPFAAKLVAEFGDRVVWGTDWPHIGIRTGTPDDGVLADLIATFAPTDASRQAVLVDNPARLYGFV